MLSEQDSVLVFYQKTGLALSKIQKLCAGTRASVQYVESIRGGKNSIDFQIITELGVLVGKHEADYAYVISQDKGYAASIDALRARMPTPSRRWRCSRPSSRASGCPLCCAATTARNCATPW